MIAARLNESSLLDIAERLQPAAIKPMRDWVGEYYLRFAVLDRPGVLSQISGALGEHNISITSVYQPERDEGQQVTVVMMTHEAREEDVQRALSSIEDLEVSLDKPMLIRVEKI